MLLVSNLPVCLAFTMNLKMWLAVALVMSMVAFWVVYYLLERKKKARLAKTVIRPAAPASRPVFDELCERHQLAGEEVTTLRSIAQESRLQYPALVFVDPSHLEQSANHGNGTARVLLEKLFA